MRSYNAKELGERALKAVSVALGNKKLFNVLVGRIKPSRLEVVPRSRPLQTAPASSTLSRGVCKGKLSTYKLKEIPANELDGLSIDDMVVWDETNDFETLSQGIKQWLHNHTDLWFEGEQANSFEK